MAVPLVDAATIVNECDTSGAMVEPNQVDSRLVLTFRAEAAVRMDFDKVNETKEQFDPDQQVTRSTQTVNSTSKTTEATQAVTAQNNLPNADTGAPGNGSQEGRQELMADIRRGGRVALTPRQADDNLRAPSRAQWPQENRWRAAPTQCTRTW